jgi:hypothetical protein
VIHPANFYLGAHHPQWLRFAEFPLFVSRRRLQRYKTLPRAQCRWALDSGGFTELSMLGDWTLGSRDYVALARRYRDEIGNLEWAAPQDWMCEPFILAKTRSSVESHQRRTVRNYVGLMEMAPDIPWIPVLQGWQVSDYMRCIDLYSLYRVDLTKCALVGVGSICRRQGEVRIAMLLDELARHGIRLHGFGIKLKGLELAAQSLASADSMAWSFSARREPTQCGSTTHKNCANCYEYARQWRSRVISLIERVAGSPLQPLPDALLSDIEDAILMPRLPQNLPAPLLS